MPLHLTECKPPIQFLLKNSFLPLLLLPDLFYLKAVFGSLVFSWHFKQGSKQLIWKTVKLTWYQSQPYNRRLYSREFQLFIQQWGHNNPLLNNHISTIHSITSWLLFSLQNYDLHTIYTFVSHIHPPPMHIFCVYI